MFDGIIGVQWGDCNDLLILQLKYRIVHLVYHLHVSYTRWPCFVISQHWGSQNTIVRQNPFCFPYRTHLQNTNIGGNKCCQWRETNIVDEGMYINHKNKKCVIFCHINGCLLLLRHISSVGPRQSTWGQWGLNEHETIGVL